MNGIINVLKPPAMSSNGVVVFLKGLLREKKIGHAGTLDPGASGVLPVLVGKCTRLSDTLMQMGKEYIAEVCFGISTDTLDSYGSVTERQNCRVNEEEFKNALDCFRGIIWQTPPAYSAVKIDGVSSYKLARRGEAVQKPPRKAIIYDISYICSVVENKFMFKIRCSKGTYIRSIALELGKMLNVPAHLSFLLRTEAGGLRIEDSYTIDELKEAHKKGDYTFVSEPTGESLSMHSVEISHIESLKLKNGVNINFSTEFENEDLLVYSGGELLGIGVCQEGMMKLRTSLFVTEDLNADSI